MIHLDTSVLIDAMTGPKRSAPQLRRWIDNRERILVSTLVLYEWLRGPRLREEIEAQEALFPPALAIPFGPQEAAVAAKPAGVDGEVVSAAEDATAAEVTVDVSTYS